MFLLLGKCLIRWNNVLSVSRNKSVTHTVISVNRPFIIRFSRYMSGTHAVIAWLLGSTYRSREPRATEEINFVTG